MRSPASTRALGRDSDVPGVRLTERQLLLLGRRRLHAEIDLTVAEDIGDGTADASTRACLRGFAERLLSTLADTQKRRLSLRWSPPLAKASSELFQSFFNIRVAVASSCSSVAFVLSGWPSKVRH